jgi:fibronectin type 3 domain-containing protein
MISGLTLPLTLSAGQNVSFSVKFAPKSSGAASASLAFATVGTGSAATQAVSGTGAVAPPAAAEHTVGLSWKDNTAVSAYNIYRGGATGGPYTKVNASPDAGNAYTDDSAASGATFFYVVTSLDD